ncbi:MAG: peptidoglycan editing factor PgeF [Bryobacteraceae bacterium]
MSDIVLRYPELSEFDWLEHGFATRNAVDWFDESRLAHLKQIHSDRVQVATVPGHLGEGDALISRTPGVVIGVRTADCLPLLLADPVRRAVAAVHAGWRGTDANVTASTLRTMQALFGTRPEDVVAAIGPGIGVCCYEVSEDVAARFTRWFPEWTPQPGKRHVDLVETNRRQLFAAGVRQIHSGAPCTRCDDRFHSYRRDGEAAGRMYSVIFIHS